MPEAVFSLCAYMYYIISSLLEISDLIAAVNLNFYFLHAKPDDGYFS